MPSFLVSTLSCVVRRRLGICKDPFNISHIFAFPLWPWRWVGGAGCWSLLLWQSGGCSCVSRRAQRREGWCCPWLVLLPGWGASLLLIGGWVSGPHIIMASGASHLCIRWFLKQFSLVLGDSDYPNFLVHLALACLTELCKARGMSRALCLWKWVVFWNFSWREDLEVFLRVSSHSCYAAWIECLYRF